MMLLASMKEVTDMRFRVEALLNTTQRKNVKKLLTYMRKNNYYEVSHPRMEYPNGLVWYNMEVLLHMARIYDPADSQMGSYIIVALLHDLCYLDKDVAKKELLVPGKKSLEILYDLGFDLYPEETQAILWHTFDTLPLKYQQMECESLWSALRFAIKLSNDFPLTHAELNEISHGRLPQWWMVTDKEFEATMNRRNMSKYKGVTFAMVVDALNNAGIDEVVAYKILKSTYESTYPYYASGITNEQRIRLDEQLRMLAQAGDTPGLMKLIFKSEDRKLFIRDMNRKLMYEALRDYFNYSKSYDAIMKQAPSKNSWENIK